MTSDRSTHCTDKDNANANVDDDDDADGDGDGDGKRNWTLLLWYANAKRKYLVAVGQLKG